MISLIALICFILLEHKKVKKIERYIEYTYKLRINYPLFIIYFHY